MSCKLLPSAHIEFPSYDLLINNTGDVLPTAVDGVNSSELEENINEHEVHFASDVPPANNTEINIDGEEMNISREENYIDSNYAHIKGRHKTEQ